MLSSPRSNVHAQDDKTAELEVRVKDMVHSAFWNEALESLSSSSADKQLPRLRRLYEDLLEAVKPLLPGRHPVIVTLSLPLSPTSAPLRSAATHLREILVALRERASPARDAYVDGLIQALDEPNQLATTEELARLVADTARSILQLTEWMKDDLSQFMVGSVEEKDLKAMITQQAMLREKSLILQLWAPGRIELSWKAWLGGLDTSVYPGAETVQPPHHRWAYRLVQALATNAPITCPLPTIRIPGTDSPEQHAGESEDVESPQNILPPPFFVTTPALLTAQNYLQALVIAASLRSLVRLPASSLPASSGDNPASFTERIWTLLRSSVDEEPGTENTKVVNLADEVVRVRRVCADDAHPCGPEEEARLRAAVDRTLQPRDPVFLLLQKRLMQALAAWLVSSPGPSGRSGSASPNGRASTPVHMQTGRERPGKRPRLHLGLDNPKSVFVAWERERRKPLVIKGFEDDVLAREIWETFKKVGMVVDWTDRVWQDLVETGEIGGLPEDGKPEGAREQQGKDTGADAHV
ncbi:hypothetical protein BD309DRAFT_878291 [Dichomitus squalens]|uniref:Uncharacterized protein n=1 Tax=Dichomitus squalens TaxID=114155 RepID=A0A4Q9NAU7_9APHY|nr:hypothetical protein BD309DRAFT_878291 [Dichomitus squalens]TBU56880.1 hypothetical protein BD310DRAFT_822764 [Dichomitus squalens]